jgi:superfamily I DNA/RNA helicase
MDDENDKTKELLHARFEDGKLILPSKEEEKIKIDKHKKPEGMNLDYLFVLKAIQEIPFGVGRNLLIDFLQGKRSNKSVVRNMLHLKKNFGSLAYEKEEIFGLIDNLLLNDLIGLKSVNTNRLWKVLKLTTKGRQEIENPSLYKRKLAFNFKDIKTEITDEDRLQFKKFEEFLSKFNDEQKKSIICTNKHVLCIAGAGSGKTTVLTKRVEFLVKNHLIDPKKILAITFTRKARQEMIKRLSKAENLDQIMVETFNSFCEKTLRTHNNFLYDKPIRVVTYKDKILMINKALSKLNTNIQNAINVYFSDSQIKGKTDEQLANIFRNDCFFIRDYFKFKNRKVVESSFETSKAEHKKSVKLVIGVCNYIEAHMKRYGLRDFSDQLMDTIRLFENYPELIPEFDHILIDEYQDVNSTQVHLVDLLLPENLFCVGDPRQSIYGWRGSDIRYILNFEDKYPDCDIITLTKNYRSTKHIVDLINNSIKNMRLADLHSSLDGKKDIHLLKFESENEEYDFVLQKILESDVSRSEIFVLARTNRQLNEFSELLKKKDIGHVIRSDEVRRSVDARKDDATLATIHGIKGLEAETVFVVGCNGVNFPCKGSEHPIIEMIKVEEYDKEEEERRLFYVAMSRAKNSLYLTYYGKKHTYFITKTMKKMIEKKETPPKSKKEIKEIIEQSSDVITRLKDWRREVSKIQNIPPYLVLCNRTLEDIAEKMPHGPDDLEGIYGIGSKKIEKYGKEVLSIING